MSTRRSQAEMGRSQSVTVELDRLQGTPAHAVILLDDDGRILAWNAGAIDMFGWSAGEALAGDSPLDMQLITREARETGCHDGERWMQRKDGSQFWASTLVMGVGDGVSGLFLAIVSDRTEKKEAEEARGRSEAQYRMITEAIPQLVWRSHTDGHWDWAGPQWHQFTGQTQVASLVDGWLDMIHPDDRRSTEQIWSAATKRCQAFSLEHRLRRADGTYVWFQTRATPFRGGDDPEQVLHWFGTSTDIGTLREATDKSLFLAHHDALTKAANRVLLGERLDHETTIDDPSSNLGVFCLDLDRFKECNERAGYKGGDVVLQEVADRLRTVLAPDDLFARVGGDEFVVLRRGADPELDETALRLRASVQGALPVDSYVFHPGVSVGFAVCPADGRDPEELMRKANVSLARAKSHAGGGACRFDVTMDRAARERRDLLADLDEAFATGGLELHYQPFFKVSDGALCGYEALARWTHASRGAVPPGIFVPLAETSGRIGELESWITEQACATASAWNGPVSVAVNLSPSRVRDSGFVGKLSRVLDTTGLDPRRLELEITENLLIENPDEVKRKLQQLRALGIRIALDDFGTGYSSLSYLRRFPFDKIKIDQSFVHAMSGDDVSHAIVTTIVSLGHSLGAIVTGEGVETAAQLELLRAAGCDEAQGFLLGEPRPDVTIRQ